MKTLNFKGLGNTPSSCEYAIGEIGDKAAIIFYQKELSGTSITNMIEHITIHVLVNELPSVSPDKVRVFEHYNPELKPIIEWQEVKFSDSGVIDEGKSITQKLVGLIIPSKVPPKYYVDSPEWSPVSKREIGLLTEIE